MAKKVLLDDFIFKCDFLNLMSEQIVDALVTLDARLINIEYSLGTRSRTFASEERLLNILRLWIGFRDHT